MSDYPSSQPVFPTMKPARAGWRRSVGRTASFVLPAVTARASSSSAAVLMYPCAGCRKQTSVTAGTVLHRGHLPLKVWFLTAARRNGISARQLWLHGPERLSRSACETARLLLQKRRRAMIAPDRSPLFGLVDEASMAFRTKDTPINPKPGRSHEGKMMIAGAVEIHDKAPGRLRLEVIEGYSAKTPSTFVHTNLVPGSTAISEGWSGYLRLKNVKHEPKVVGPMAAHVLLPRIHRVFGKAKRWAMGVYHGRRQRHLQ